MTPAADAAVVSLGTALCLPRLPSSPLGAPGPAGITRAALRLAHISPRFFGVGLTVWPGSECLRISETRGNSIELGHAVSDPEHLFEAGVTLGREMGAEASYVVVGESVPAGTTTALALLLALGYRAEGRVSGSMPGNAHALKTRVARASLAAAGIEPGKVAPLEAVRRVGDPMQPVAAGIALGAGCDVLLAGGSQMLAVAALVQAIGGAAALSRIAVGTTRWIVDDPSADVAGLAADISPDLALLAANLNFSESRHAGLRQYEQFLVKEGVGAGGACIAALLTSGIALAQLHRAIDDTYDELLGRLTTSDSADSRSW